MKLKTLVWLLLVAIPFSLEASEDAYDFSLRYHYYLSQPNALDETFLYDHDLSPTLKLQVGGRFQENGPSMDIFAYKVALLASYLGFLQTELRLNQNNYIYTGTGATNLSAMQYLRGRPIYPIELFGGFGWYFRFTTLSGAPIFPSFTAEGMDDFGFIGDLGVRIFFSDAVRFLVQLSTIEDIMVFNIHNPFAQAAFEYQPNKKGPSYVAFFRYRILLGFGRMDEIMAGVGVRLTVPVLDKVVIPYRNPKVPYQH